MKSNRYVHDKSNEDDPDTSYVRTLGLSCIRRRLDKDSAQVTISHARRHSISPDPKIMGAYAI